MLRKLLRDAERYRKRNQQRSIWRKFVQIVACFVVFCTTYALILPAITMEKQKCTLEEHTHTESCYKQVAAEPVVSLACTYESLGIHVHTSECFDSENRILCGLADYVLHEHNDACLDKVGNLVCRLPVVMEHKHTDDCYRIQKTSKTPETEGPHVHNADCYSTERGELICKTAETEGHAHGDACYGRGQLVCKLQEQEGHTHGNGCTETVLACELTTEPHHHGDACYQQLECELTEDETHTHNEACNGKVLNCDLTEQPHNHKDSCYQTNSLCDLPETEGHAHSDSCYESVLECKLTVEDPHTHTDSCYDRILKLSCGLEEGSPAETEAQEPAEPKLVCEKRVIQLHSHKEETCYEISEDGNLQLICTKLEVSEHIHTESCFVTEEPTEEDTHKLTCTLSEGHVHGEGCYDETDVLVCEEAENHTHGSLCYGTWELNCSKYEHIHTDECHTANDAAENTTPIETTQKGLTLGTPLVTDPSDMYDVAEMAIDGTDVTWAISHDENGEYYLTFGGTGAIPNFNSGDTGEQELWLNKLAELGNPCVHLEFGPDVTAVGNRAMEQVEISSISWGGITSIGSYAFTGGSGPSVITIPGSVKTVDSYAFTGRSNVDSFVLEEGIQTLGKECLGTGNGTAKLVIPASVENMEGLPMPNVIAYEVAAGNTNFYTDENGVLFTASNPENSSNTPNTLIGYPRCRNTDVYSIPEGIVSIHSNAFAYAEGIGKLVIPPSVEKLGDRCFEGADIGEIFIQNESRLSTIGSSPLHLASGLTNIRYPENTETQLYNLFDSDTDYEWYTHFTIPNDITTIQTMSGSFPNLKTVTYNAKNAAITTTEPFYNCSPYDLIIGGEVNVLPANFTGFVSHSAAVRFWKNAETGAFMPNTFTAANGAFLGAGDPLENLSGTFHVDENGVLYQLMEDGTAKVVYTSVDIAESITIPAAIATDANDGSKSYTVIAVGTNAFRCAKNLTSLIFAAPEQITDLAPMAMANCPSLTSVNGLYTRDAVSEIFPNATLPADIFYNTGMEQSGGNLYDTDTVIDGSGKKSLIVAHDGATSMEITIPTSGSTMQWEQTNESTGLYKMETGDFMDYHVSVGSTTEEQFVYRVYLRTTGEGAVPSFKPGDSNTFNGQVVTCYATNDPNVTYLEYVQTSGSAIKYSFSMVYPSPTTAGGSTEVWGVILTKEQAAADENRQKVFPSESGVIQSQWYTQRYDFNLTKTGKTDEINIVSNNNGSCKPGSNLEWSIQFRGLGSDADKLGRDYLQSAEFTDSITLPQGFSWDPRVTEALEAGAVELVTVNNTSYDLIAGDLKVATITRTSSSAQIRNVEACLHEYEAEGENKTDLRFSWELYNNTETDMSTSTLTITVYSDAVWINLNDLAEGVTAHRITNDVETQLKYHYSDPVTKNATADDVVNSTTAMLSLSKTSSGVTLMGEDVTYNIKLSNDGVIPYVGAKGDKITVRDELDHRSYMTPEQIEAMFTLYPEGLEIRIESASLAQWIHVTGVDGTPSSYQNSGNSKLNTAKHTLYISPVEDGYQVKVDSGETYTAPHVADALQSAGYAVTSSAKYVCEWTLQSTDSESTYFLDIGDEEAFTVYATVKNTFGILTSDYKNQHPSNPQSPTVAVTNLAKFLRNNNMVLQVSAVDKVARDAHVKKSVYKEDGTTGFDGISHEDVLTYHLDFSHYGTGSYQHLPMTDVFGGCQYLLVPKDLNPGLDDDGLDTYLYGETEYYVLNKSGNYTDVVLGEYYMKTASGETARSPMTAASIELAMETSGVRMPMAYIKWYFPELPGEEYEIHVQYNALVDMYAMGAMWLFGNNVYMNDLAGTCIYDSISEYGQTLSVEKNIVTEMGNTSHSDVTEKYTAITDGDRVIYRLTITNPNTGSMRVTGNHMADVLPLEFECFEWSKDNIELIKIEADPEAVEYQKLDEWVISNDYLDIAGDDETTFKFITWPEDAYILLKGQSSIHMYFALTYPKNGEEPLWDQYAAVVQGSKVQNSFMLDLVGETVDHDLLETGKVMLQKGVHGMYHYTEGTKFIPTGTSRQYYNIRDRHNRAVVYYVTLYNGSTKRLYLDDYMYDQLPEGFTFMRMINQPAETLNAKYHPESMHTFNDNLTYSKNIYADYQGVPVVFRDANITPYPTSDGVKFKIVSWGSQKPLRYDSSAKKYYLQQGEALTFAYACDTGANVIEDPENTKLTNTIAMAYHDHLDNGLTIIPDTVLPVNGEKSKIFTDTNDGSRLVKTKEEVQNLYGFQSTAGSEKLWLVSDVDLVQGEIIPGVTKFTDSYRRPSAPENTEYVHSAPHNAAINWRVRLHNSGTISLADYTFSDTMPAPYVFEGDIIFKYYDMYHKEIGTQTIATIPERTANDTTLSITPGNPLVIGGEAVNVGTDISLSVRKDENGNEVMTIVCGARNMAIPEGGYVDVLLTSRNPTSQFKDGFYTNYATLYPNEQPFVSSDHGHILKDESNTPVGVIGNSSVNIIFGYATSSEKRITEDSRPANTAVSINPLDNSIILERADSTFTYQLNVVNSTEYAMRKLVIIDNLPQPGDHIPFDTGTYRNSAFTVNFAEDLNFVVRITDKNGVVNTLNPEDDHYTLEFSESTDFGGEQSDDWKGNNTSKWSTQRTEKSRALRLIINDETGTLIPKDARIDVTFKAQAGADAVPGTYAWNNFGYHFGVVGTKDEMEAMPLSVGVALPSVPSLMKQLVALDGKTSVQAEENMDFKFLVYEGNAVPGTYPSAEMLRIALDAAGRTSDRIQEFTVSMDAGQTESAELLLSNVPWTWTQGRNYTITEIDTAEKYDFFRFDTYAGGHYTFTYDVSSTQKIVCKNRLEEWSIRLFKTDPEDTPLSGAVFALYRPAEDGEYIEGVDDQWGVKQTITLSGRNWCLQSIQQTEADGLLTWTGLLEKEYYLVEIKAPNGYSLPESGQFLHQSSCDENAVCNVQVENELGYTLPETGGIGTTSYTLCGLLMIAAAGLLYIHYFRRRKKNIASF